MSGSEPCKLGCICGRHRLAHNRTHGLAGTPTYNSWQSMVSRCTRPEDWNWDHYGGRGITVCEHWRNSYEAFLADMGQRPTGLTLDRENNEGNYEPGNCRWATRQEQTHNRRVPLKLDDDKVRSIRARHAAGGTSERKLAAEYGVSRAVIRQVVQRLRWAHVPVAITATETSA